MHCPLYDSKFSFISPIETTANKCGDPCPLKNIFAIKDCALVAIATGKKAQNLRELRDRLLEIHPDSIYYHFWGGMLRPRFDDPEFHNDFAIWSHTSLHDDVLAERLAVIDASEFGDMEILRQEVVDIIEERLDEIEWIPWASSAEQFHFARSHIVVFDTGRRIAKPEELVHTMPAISVSSVFYHIIDARRRTPDCTDDFRVWLESFGDKYEPLREKLASVDPFFSSLGELRQRISSLVADYFKAGKTKRKRT